MSSRLLIRGLGFTYRNAPSPALTGLDLLVEPGRTVAVVGPSGAGKTTLVRCANGLVPHFFRGELDGEVLLGARSLGHLGVAEISAHVGSVFQDFDSQLFSTNGALEVAFGPENLGVPRDEIRARVERYLAKVGLEGFERREPATLSGGEKQRLAIAAVLAMEPKVVLLDEPTTDLDPVGRADVHRILREVADAGVSVVVVEHETEEVLDLDEVAYVSEGRVRERGTPADVFLRLARAGGAPGVQVPVRARLAQHLGRTTLPDLDDLRRALRPDAAGARAATARPTLGAAVLTVEDLTHRYAGRDTPAIEQVTFEIRAGEFVALIGGNGSGKTTLAKHLNGLLRPTSGRVLVGGEDAAAQATAALARQVGYVFQDPDRQVFSPTVLDEMRFGLVNFGVPEAEQAGRIEAALAVVGLEGQEEADPFVLTRGERQRLAVASVLATEPEILVLDEPTTGLDWNDRTRMLELLADLNRRGHTILVITHSMELVAQHCRRGLVMARGRLALDAPVREIFRREELLGHAGLRPPPAWRIGAELGLATLTPEELEASLRGAGG